MQANLLFDLSGGSSFRSTSVIATTTAVTTTGGTNSVKITLTTEGFPNDTKLYYSSIGTVNANTFTDNSTSGFCIIKNNVGIITRTIMNNPSSTAPTSFNLSISDSPTGQSLTVAPPAVINDIPISSLSGNTVQFVLYRRAVVPPIVATTGSVNPATVAADVSSVDEGGTVTFTVTTSGLADGTYYWDLTSDSLLTSSRFVGLTDSGSFTLTNNTGTITRTILTNCAVDGLTSFAINVRQSSVTGTILGTSTQILVNDTSTSVPTISASTSSVNEGNSVTFTVTSSGIPNGTVLYWSTSGTTSAADFSDNASTGSFTISNNSGTITRTLKNDHVTEGSETVILSVRVGSTSGTTVATSSTVTIGDISIDPTYSVSPSTDTLNEGESVTFNVTTTDIDNGTVLYWSTGGTTVAADFSDNASSGSFTVNGNSGSITRTLKNDHVTEGSETVILYVRTGSTSGTVVATSSAVTVVDTSINPTYTVSNITTTNMNEGEDVTFDISTTEVDDGTVLYWTNSGTTVGADFVNGQNSGSFTVNGNSGSVQLFVKNDRVTEGSQTIILQVKTGSTSGTTVATSNTVTVNDTSLNPTYTVSNITTTNMNEGDDVTFDISTTELDDGTTLYWTNSGSTIGADFVNGQNSGSFTINGNGGSVQLYVKNDRLTEGSQTIILQVRTTSTSGTVVATSNTVTVNDTSLNPTYSVSPNTSSVNEGDEVTFNITTTEIDDGTTLYWTNSGSTNAADFTDNTNSGSFEINGNSGSVTKTLSLDKTTEGSQTIIFQIRTTSTSGSIVATSSSVTVNDTSRTPTYSVSPSTTSVNEGDNVTFNITTTFVDDGTTLYWSNDGTTNSSDFNNVGNNGSFDINGNSGSVTIELSNDTTTEGSQTIIFKVRTGSTSGTVVATASTVTVNDTSITPATFTATYLIVAGGGGGGGGASLGPASAYQFGAGGGGGGGVVTGSAFFETADYSITVGGGGTGGQVGYFDRRATNGNDSTIDGPNVNVSSVGGGGGGSGSDGSNDWNNGFDGGSGGGAGTNGTNGSGTSGQGNNGGSSSYARYGGGGGGANSAGGNAGSSSNGSGGSGRSVSPFSGTYGAGGSGGGSGQSSASAGADNTGNGGQGWGGASISVRGGGGGSGIVIIRYTSSIQLATGGTVTSSGGVWQHRFTSSGTLALNR